MMYEGAIKFTTMASESIEKGDASNQGKYIRKAHDIINELSLSLDFKKGGDVAPRLESLYQFILSQLTLANIKSDKQPLQVVLNILNPLLPRNLCKLRCHSTLAHKARGFRFVQLPPTTY